MALDLNAAASGEVDDRCKAIKRLSDYWALKRPISGEFSDLPVETPQATTEPIPADEVEAIAGLLSSALADQDAKVREQAAICLCHAPRSTAGVAAAMAVALSSEDSSALWYLQQMDFQKHSLPEPGPFVANLIRHLKTGNFSSVESATSLIKHFGDRFVPHTEAVVEEIRKVPPSDQWQVLLALSETGLTEAAAEKLVRKVEGLTAETRSAAFVALLRYPERAAGFLRAHTDLGEELSRFDGRWCEFLYSKRPDHQEVRAALIAMPRLGPLNLALIGSPDSIPELTRELDAAGEHRKTLLRACIRACGGDLGEVVHLSQEVPIRFKPKSAWPETDPRRRSGESGHGDGFTEILVTGEIRFADGGHPSEVAFWRTNDEMLLGESREEALPVKYEAATGRFVLRETVFAAYDSGKSREPGPYQTGSAQVRIEAKSSAPLTIQFFDEMPHVVIELQRE